MWCVCVCCVAWMCKKKKFPLFIRGGFSMKLHQIRTVLPATEKSYCHWIGLRPNWNNANIQLIEVVNCCWKLFNAVDRYLLSIHVLIVHLCVSSFVSVCANEEWVRGEQRVRLLLVMILISFCASNVHAHNMFSILQYIICFLSDWWTLAVWKVFSRQR